MLNWRHKLIVNIQWLISWICAPVFIGGLIALMHFWSRYRIRDVVTLRHDIKDIIKLAGNKPVLVCANHLTLIDSFIINMALFRVRDYLLRWRFMPWNMPERKNFAKSLILRILCYLGKCIPIERGGSTESRDIVLQKFQYLLARGELVCVFPEGTRSRTGRLKGTPPTYSVGKLVLNNPNTQVLCVYARGDQQTGWSQLPKRGDQFKFLVKLIEPKTTEQGRRGHKAVAEEIMATLETLEDQYFSAV